MSPPPRSSAGWFRGLPLWTFLTTYLVTCVAAAMPLALDYRPLRTLVAYFAGVTVPAEFDPTHAYTFWTLLFGCPAFLALGYIATQRLTLAWCLRHGQVVLAGPESSRLPAAIFAISVTLAFTSLVRAGAFAGVQTWWDYGAWVQARWALFAKLTYFEFTNLYVWLPVSTAWLMATSLMEQRRNAWLTWLPLVLAGTVTLLLYQKKSLLSLLLLAIFTIAIQTVLSGRWKKTSTHWAFAAVGAMTLVYLTMTVFPVWKDTTTRIEQGQAGRDLALESALEIQELLGEKRAAHVAAYALLSPFTRTSLPAFYYAEIFPSKKPFFGMDLAQDVLGIGSMPDDNRVVWAVMYPSTPGGSASAPFQFILYSQVGLSGALVLSALVGVVLAFAWTCLTSGRRSNPTQAVLGAILIIFAVYLAIDSPRNSLISSYGLAWGVLLVLVVRGIHLIFSRLTTPR